MNREEAILRYAQLIARTGIRVRKGDSVILRAELDQPAFVETLVQACYEAGAAKVAVFWQHQPLERLHAAYQTEETLCRVEDWELARMEQLSGALPSLIHLESSDPDGLRGADQQKLALRRQSRYAAVKPYSDRMEGRHPWCVAAVPGVRWAQKVFPGEPAETAVEKLWDAILSTCRVTEDPAAAWEAHNRALHRHCDYLNALGIERLEYRASNGTDLTVGMIPEARFCGGDERTASGRLFNANLPTEECYITPMRGEAEGIVYASKPLSYQGELIEEFCIRFEHGRAAEAHARTNEALLRRMLAMDEGAAYLGECALVPYSSPIRESGLLFYSTLFDENAACHLALGMGYVDTIRGAEHRTLEEMRAMGVNDSMIHEDFMIGTADLSVTAVCRNGRRVPVFRDGEWAFSVE